MRRVLNLSMLLMMSSSLMSAEIILQNPNVDEQAPSFSGINSYGELINLSDFEICSAILGVIIPCP